MPNRKSDQLIEVEFFLQKAGYPTAGEYRFTVYGNDFFRKFPHESVIRNGKE